VTPVIETLNSLSSVTVEEIRTVAAFDALRPRWNSLVEQLAVPSPFHSWEWNRTWWNHFGGNHKLCILVFNSGGSLAGIAQLYERQASVGPQSLRVLVPLGWEDLRRHTGLTELCQLIVPDKARAEVMLALADWLGAHRWPLTILPGLEEKDCASLPLVLRKRVAGVGDMIPFRHRSLPSTSEALISSLSKSMRSNVRYYPRLLQREGVNYQFRVLHAPHEIADALPTFFELHRARATAPGLSRHSDKFRFADRRAFIREVAPLLAAQSSCKLGLLSIGQEVVATQMWLEFGGSVFIYHSGYRPTWSRYSVAMVTMLEVLKFAISNGKTRADFLIGDGLAKDRWETQASMRRNLLISRHNRVIGSLLRARDVIRRAKP
jgi:CelD/BcsL family acetyltransferase involved in cellulose biosynthesis